MLFVCSFHQVEFRKILECEIIIELLKDDFLKNEKFLFSDISLQYIKNYSIRILKMINDT